MIVKVPVAKSVVVAKFCCNESGGKFLMPGFRWVVESGFLIILHGIKFLV